MPAARGRDGFRVIELAHESRRSGRSRKAARHQIGCGSRAAPGWAVVRLQAAALNHRDLWIQQGRYAGLKFPIILGSDGAGVVRPSAARPTAIGWGARSSSIPASTGAPIRGRQGPGFPHSRPAGRRHFGRGGRRAGGQSSAAARAPLGGAGRGAAAGGAHRVAGVVCPRPAPRRRVRAHHRHRRRRGALRAAVCGRGGRDRPCHLGLGRQAGAGAGDGRGRWRQLPRCRLAGAAADGRPGFST